MLHLRRLTFRSGDISQPVGDYDLCFENRADLGGKRMPEVPAQDLLSPVENSARNQTERMATPEELYALKRIAEVESALAELAKTEYSSKEDSFIAAEIATQVPGPELESALVVSANVEIAAVNNSASKVELPPAELAKVATEPETASAATEITEDVATPAAENTAGMAGSWMLEFAVILDQHRIWVESGGEAGTKADLCGANLENADLTGANLQGAFLQRSSLLGADLSMANLRHASLVQADLCNANLLGAELRGANLMGATLYGAEGLWLGRLGGANLYDAMLPETISSIDGSKAVWEATRTARWFYLLMLSVCVLCAAGVATTTDARLILDGQTVTIARLGNALPINAFYLIAPIALLVVFVRFQFLLLRVWSSMSALPAVFPDGQTVERGGPWYLMGLVRRHFRWLRESKTPVSGIESVVASLLAYWAVPATVALRLMRYLVRQDLRGTSLHVLFFVLSVSVATGFPSVVSRLVRSGELRRPTTRSVGKLALVTLRTPLLAGLVLMALSFGVILGVPADQNAARYFSASPLRWASEAFRLLGYRPYADLTEATLVPPHARAASARDAPGDGAGAKLNENSLRYARAYRAVLGGAPLWRADLVGGYLTEPEFATATLRESH